jgi:hypothetical protein
VLDIETDLREFDEENPSRRISEVLKGTKLEQQQESLARKNQLNDVTTIFWKIREE